MQKRIATMLILVRLIRFLIIATILILMERNVVLESNDNTVSSGIIFPPG
jgi:hypothetical protein